MLRIAATICACVLLSGCTQVGGHIGHWFGQWRMTAIDIDGQPDAAYNGNTYWSFQSDIVKINDSYGTWSTDADDTRLILRFDYSDDKRPAGTGIYAPPASTHLPAGTTALDILQLTRTDITLRYTTDGTPPVAYTYHLQKWW